MPPRRRTAPTLALLALGAPALLACASAAAGAPPAPSGLVRCAPSAALAAELVEPRALSARCGGDAGCWRDGVARARALVDRHPDAYDAHRAYVLTVRAAARVLGREVADRAAADYAERARRQPDEPAWAHLQAQVALDGEEYRSRLEAIAAAHPDYPWVHLSLAFQGGAGAGPDQRERARASLERFVALCPERLAEPARALELIGDDDLLRPLADRLRRVALERRDAEALATLWPLAVRWLPDEERAAGLASITGELAGFAASEVAAALPGLRALAAGYRATGDEAARRAVEDRLLAGFPCVDDALRVREARFRAAHPDPRTGLDTALSALEAELARCPADELAARTMVQWLEAAPPARGADLLAAVDRLLALPARRLDLVPSEPGWLARLYLDHGLRLERVPALIEADAAEAGAARAREAAAGDAAADVRFGYRTRETLRLRVRYALARGDLAGARRLLGELDRATATAPGGGRERIFAGLSLYPDERTRLDLLEARASTAEGRPQAALDRLARLLPDETLGPAVREEAEAAWRARHGSGQGFAEWVAGLARGLAADGGWRSVDRPLPAAALRDLGGGAFDWAELRGRTVLVVLWATWCGPCREQVTGLGPLAERLRDRADRALVALNVDRANGALFPFLGREQVAARVVLDGDALFDEGLAGVPAAWIVSPAGRIVRERVGAGGDPARWQAEAEAELDAVAAAAPAPADGPASAAAPAGGGAPRP